MRAPALLRTSASSSSSAVTRASASVSACTDSATKRMRSIVSASAAATRASSASMIRRCFSAFWRASSCDLASATLSASACCCSADPLAPPACRSVDSATELCATAKLAVFISVCRARSCSKSSFRGITGTSAPITAACESSCKVSSTRSRISQGGSCSDGCGVEPDASAVIMGCAWLAATAGEGAMASAAATSSGVIPSSTASSSMLNLMRFARAGTARAGRRTSAVLLSCFRCICCCSSLHCCVLAASSSNCCHC